jgi:glycolate oxidase
MSQLNAFLSDLNSHLDPSEIVTENLERYSSDNSSIKGTPARVVLRPTSTEKIEPILVAANAHSITIVTRASGTSTTGAPLVTHLEVILSTEALNSIIEIDTGNRVVVTQPGVITGKLKAEVEQKGLYYPPDPASLNDCSIGGNVATNAGGPCCLKYGVTGDYVLGLKGVYGNGIPFELGGKLYKNVAGLDLISLLTGSEGILAVITEITLRLIPKPLSQRLLVVDFSTTEDAVNVLTDLMANGLFPSAAEFIDRTCIEAVRSYAEYRQLELADMTFDFSLVMDEMGAKAPTSNNDDAHTPHPPEARLFLQFDYDTPFDYDTTLTPQQDNRISALLAHNNVRSILEADDSDGIEHLWELRRHCSPALRMKWPQKQSHDITIPPANIPKYLGIVETLSTKFSVKIIAYGHIGDGNLHVNILPDINSTDQREHLKSQLSEISRALLQSALELGGTISGEHGIGLSKKDYMNAQFNATDLDIMKKIKATFDPNMILNPGKVLS